MYSFLLFAAVALAQSCPKLEIVFARATTEPPTGISATATEEQFRTAANRIWSKGYGAAGASFVANVTALIPGSVGYPVPYPADFSLGTSAPKGVENMIKRLESQAKNCPDIKFVLGGHSQGGGVTVSAIPKIPKEIIDKVIAVTMFGSPPCPASVQDRCKSYCNQGDNVCEGGGKGGKGGKAGGGKVGGGKLGGGKTDGLGKAGGMGKLGGAKGKGDAPVGDAPAETPAETGVEFVRRQKGAVADCAGVNNPASVQERGHSAPGAEGAHLMYNKNGYYVKAAACFVVQQWNKVKGA